MADVVEDIKNRLGVHDVISQYVQLKKAGQNYKGLCPFHSEKSPSFVVSPQKQIFHCFGCNKGGDIFTFVQEIEGVEFGEALKLLASKAGVKLPEKAWDQKTKGEKEEFFKAHDLAAAFFEEQLYKTNDGKKVLEYLYKRGLNDATIKEFRIGFAPDSYDSLYPLLIKRGISKNVLLKSGLVSSKKIAAEKVYDKYRGRLIFPIFDNLGRICGFGGRALKKDQMPKYLNSPENLIYNKSRVLYGLSHAKQAIKQEGKAVFVEGYFDVVLPYQEGVQNVVATSGTALTADQVKIMKRFTSSVVTCFDSDSAGFEATKRAFAQANAADMIVKTAVLDQKDPADFVLEHSGEAFKAVIEDSKDFLLFYIEKLVKLHDTKTNAGRRTVLQELMPYYKALSATAKDFYVRELSRQIGVSETSLYDEIGNFSLPVDHPARGGSQKAEGEVAKFEIDFEGMVVAILLKFSGLFSEAKEILKEDDFKGDLKAIYKALDAQYNPARAYEDQWDLEDQFPTELREKSAILLLYAEDKYGQLAIDSVRDELQKLIARMRKHCKMLLLRDLHSKIAQAEKDNDKEGLLELLKQQQELLSQ